MSEVVVSLAVATIQAGTPLLLATLGEIYAERSGVLNLGVEGMMIIGAVTGFLVSYLTLNPWIAIVAAALAGGLTSLPFAFLVITLRGNQVIAGLALTMLGLGLSSLMGKGLIGAVAPSLPRLKAPGLAEIPVVGPIVFNHDPVVYASFALVPILWYLLFKTKFGLNVRSTGEDPASADAAGVNVYLVRYVCIFIGGLLAGLGGGYLSLAYTLMWIENMTAGRGFIAVALTIFSMWNPSRAVIGAYLFGGLTVLQFKLQVAGTGIPAEFLLMTPYLSTIAVLLVATREAVKRRIGAPAALCQPYVRGGA